MAATPLSNQTAQTRQQAQTPNPNPALALHQYQPPAPPAPAVLRIKGTHIRDANDDKIELRCVITEDQKRTFTGDQQNLNQFKLSSAQLPSFKFNIDAIGTHFERANLSSSIFIKSIKDSNFSGANLSDCDLSRVTDMSGVIFDANTQLKRVKFPPNILNMLTGESRTQVIREACRLYSKYSNISESVTMFARKRFQSEEAIIQQLFDERARDPRGTAWIVLAMLNIQEPIHPLEYRGENGIELGNR
jgi:hypothetical protein